MPIGPDGWFREDPPTYEVAPTQPPREVAGFRFPSVADGANSDGTPRIAAERGYISSPAERERVLGYLTAGARVVESARYGPDGFDHTRQLAVRVGYRTDGSWIWPDAVEYYLREHNVAPEPDLYRHIVAHGYRCPEVSREVVTAAATATQWRTDQRRGAAREAMRERGQLREGDPERFQPEVSRALLQMGWYKGRDVREWVDEWLAIAREPYMDREDPDDFAPYRPSPAALAVMAEFGALGFAGGAPGITAAKTQFRIYPGRREDDLSEFMFKAQQLGERLGRSVFQVGLAERGLAAVAVAEDGKVYLLGPYNLFMGTDIDDALTRMVLGIAPPDTDELL